MTATVKTLDNPDLFMKEPYGILFDDPDQLVGPRPWVADPNSDPVGSGKFSLYPDPIGTLAM